MDELRDLALEVAHRILAGTEAERYELGVDNTKSASVGNLVELARQLLMEDGVGRAVQVNTIGRQVESRASG
jgi:hypothetical protein